MGFIGDAVGAIGDVVGGVVGGVKDVFGLGGGGGANAEFNPLNLDQSVSLEDINGQKRRSLGALDQQQAFLNALQSQGGITNQSNVFNQQQALANQLGLQAQGEGPNPALAQLANTTGQNVAAQAALMAGQRGSAANPGLIARQAGMQGANIQQQAVGQGALMRAQQQLAAQQLLQGQQNAMQGVAGNQIQNLGGATMGLAQGNLANQQQLLNAMAAYNNARVSNAGSTNAANAGMASGAQRGQQDFVGGLAKSGADIVGKFLGTPDKKPEGNDAPPVTTGYNGGLVHSYADGGEVGFAERFLKGWANDDQSAPAPAPMMAAPIAAAPQSPMKSAGSSIGDTLGKAASTIGSLFLNQGAVVPGKAKVSGDSLKNDKVPALLSPKEIVLPRSVTLDPNAPDKAKAFVEAILAKQSMKRGKK